MNVLSNLYLTHGLMLACAFASVVVALPEGSGRIVAAWRIPVAALLADRRDAAVAGAGQPDEAPGVIDVDPHPVAARHAQHAGDGRVATVLLAAMATAEVALAIRGPADQPTMELGMTVIASFLLARAAAVMVRAYHEPQADLHDRPAPPVEE